MSIMVEMEAYCTCGVELEVTYKMKNDILVVMVEPCEDCLAREWADGHQAGHDEGYEECENDHAED